MALSIIVLLVFVSVLAYLYHKNYWIVGKYLVGVYCVTLTGSILLVATDETVYKPTIVPALLFCALLVLFFWPFFRSSPVLSGFHDDRQIMTFKIVGLTISVYLIIGALLVLPLVNKALSLNLGELRNHNLVNELVASNVFQALGIRICEWTGHLGYVTLIMFFYALSFLPNNYYLKTLLVISSLVPTYYAVLVAGRTNLIYWILFFIFCFFLFREQLSKTAKQYMVIIGAVIFGVLALYFVVVTIQRAVLYHRSNSEFLLSYIGQAFPNFCKFFDNFHYHPYTLERILPNTSRIITGSRFYINDYREMLFYNTSMDIGVFYTFLGDLFVDVGLPGIIVYLIVYRVIVDRFIDTESFDLSKIIVLGMIFQIPLFGVFYYSYWKYSSTIGFALALGVAFILKKVRIVIKR